MAYSLVAVGVPEFGSRKLKEQEIGGSEGDNDTNCLDHRIDPVAHRRTSHLAVQFGMGVLPERRDRARPDHSHYFACGRPDIANGPGSRRTYHELGPDRRKLEAG
jgi:hypothetical protein